MLPLIIKLLPIFNHLKKLIRMCFSAEASFGAGAILTVAGIVTIKQIKQPHQMALAAIPLFFGIQQIAEGFVWLTLTHIQMANWQNIAIHCFTFFSHILWPVWVAFAVLLFEKDTIKKNILFLIFSIGLLLSLSEVYFIATYGVQASVKGHHIEYTIAFPKPFIDLSEIVYALTTIVPCFIASYKRLRLFAAVLIISIIVATIFYKTWLISVWCFFAAVLSIIIYTIIKKAPALIREKV